jgi:hypothetical protein
MEEKSALTDLGLLAAIGFLLCGIALAAAGISGAENVETIDANRHNIARHYVTPSDGLGESFPARIDEGAHHRDALPDGRIPGPLAPDADGG